MYYEVAGDGEPVIFIMGLGGDHTGWAFQVPEIAAAGYQCVAFDNRDAGQTAESPIPTYSIRDMASDTIGFMDALGIDRAHIVGASMGGLIAQELVLAHPQRVGTLTLICTHPGTDPYLRLVLDSFRAMRSCLDRVNCARAMSVWIMSRFFLSDEKNLRDYVDFLCANPHPQSDAAYFRQLDACSGHDALDRIHEIQVPTVIMVGEEDIITPPRLSRIIADRISGARLVIIPGAAHGVFLEKAAEVCREIIGFLREHRLEPSLKRQTASH